jgi:hypothetical protein
MEERGSSVTASRTIPGVDGTEDRRGWVLLRSGRRDALHVQAHPTPSSPKRTWAPGSGSGECYYMLDCGLP